MKLKLLILFCTLTMLMSCKGQNSSKSTEKTFDNIRYGTLCDTVTSLSNAIMIIYQDKKNSFWFGSRGQGVFKYNGKYILQYTVKHGLVSNDIWGIQEDKFGNIYLDTQDGVSKYDGKKFSTLTVNNNADNEWKSEPDDLWFKGNWNINGPYRFDGKSLHHLEFPKNKLADELQAKFPNMNWSPYGLYSLYKDKKGNIWFGTSNLGIYRFDGKSISWLYEKHLTDVEESGGSFGIRSIFEDSESKFWFCNTSYRFHIYPGDSIVSGKSLIRYQREKGMESAKEKRDLIYFMSITEDDKH
ncbi:MAG TPA: two-component regulator propeller domain-containing protein, partial [Saprospiraceae bacterium]|nr:two-component regulator propeller domain-containing protein [Saprospiraceae bacterium]